MSYFLGCRAVRIVALCVLLAACQAKQVQTSVLFDGDMQAIQAQTQGAAHESFTLRVAKDGQISDSEVLEAADHFVS